MDRRQVDDASRRETVKMGDKLVERWEAVQPGGGIVGQANKGHRARVRNQGDGSGKGTVQWSNENKKQRENYDDRVEKNGRAGLRTRSFIYKERWEAKAKGRLMNESCLGWILQKGP